MFNTIMGAFVSPYTSVVPTDMSRNVAEHSTESEHRPKFDEAEVVAAWTDLLKKQ
jgi:hypothetical protein